MKKAMIKLRILSIESDIIYATHRLLTIICGMLADKHHKIYMKAKEIAERS